MSFTPPHFHIFVNIRNSDLVMSSRTSTKSSEAIFLAVLALPWDFRIRDYPGEVPAHIKRIGSLTELLSDEVRLWLVFDY